MSEVDSKIVGAEATTANGGELSLPSVLLVDDQPARLLTYEALLEGVGVHCVRALSGREALDRLLRQPFALILLDVLMPDMDGFETARAIRQHPRFVDTPIIFVTGLEVTELDKLRGYEVGAVDYLSVPIVPEIFRSRVAVLVELHQRRAELKRLTRELETTRAALRTEARPPEASEPEEKAWLAALLSSMTDEVYFTNTNKSYTYASPAALSEFGHASISEVPVEQIVANIEVLRPDGTPRLLAEAPPLRALQGEVIREEEQIVRVPRREELRHRSVNAAPVRDGAGTIIGSVSIVRDVTDQKRAEAALRSRETRSLALLKLGDEFRSLTAPADLALPRLKYWARPCR